MDDPLHKMQQHFLFVFLEQARVSREERRRGGGPRADCEDP